MNISHKFEMRFYSRLGDDVYGYPSEAVTQLLAHTRALEAMLKKHEWHGFDHSLEIDACPECLAICYSLEPIVHAPDCQLAALLRDVD